MASEARQALALARHGNLWAMKDPVASATILPALNVPDSLKVGCERVLGVWGRVARLISGGVVVRQNVRFRAYWTTVQATRLYHTLPLLSLTPEGMQDLVEELKDERRKCNHINRCKKVRVAAGKRSRFAKGARLLDINSVAVQAIKLNAQLPESTTKTPGHQTKIPPKRPPKQRACPRQPSPERSGGATE